MPSNKATDRWGTMYPDDTVGNPGIVMSYMCVDCVCLPLGMLISKGFLVGVAMIKSTTSYFWFLVTFRHNRICGLAVAFKNYFLGCLPALLKIIPKALPKCSEEKKIKVEHRTLDRK